MSEATKQRATAASKSTTVSLPKVAAKQTAVKPQASGDSTRKATTKQQTKLPSISGKPPAAANDVVPKEPAASTQVETTSPTDIIENTTTAPVGAPVVNDAPANGTDPIRADPMPIDAGAAATKDSSDKQEGVSTVEPVVTPEVEVVNPVKRDGEVKLIYEQYSEMFPIVNGSTTQENVDEVYCLSFVMPNCLVHLSIHDPATKRRLEIEEKFEELFLPEIPRGTYQNLVADQTYYVYVEQESAQLERDQAMTRLRLQNDPTALAALKKDDGRVLESCSCIYGNPCVDEYGCRDWANRFAIATKNGWKGF
eukprot:gene17893-20715_t